MPDKKRILVSYRSFLKKGLEDGSLAFWYAPLYWSLLNPSAEIVVAHIELFRFFHTHAAADPVATTDLVRASHSVLSTLNSTEIVEFQSRFLEVIQSSLEFFGLNEKIKTRVPVKIQLAHRRSAAFLNNSFSDSQLQESLKKCCASKFNSSERHIHCRNYILMRHLTQLELSPEFVDTKH